MNTCMCGHDAELHEAGSDFVDGRWMDWNVCDGDGTDGGPCTCEFYEPRVRVVTT